MKPLVINEALNWGKQELQVLVGDGALMEARLLLSHVTGGSAVDLITHPNESVSQEMFTQFQNFVERRKNCEPIAHLLGKKEFMGLEFVVDASTLIPRPETETLVLELEKWISNEKIQNQKTAYRILELGIGSGCISISLASGLSEIAPVSAFEFHGIEISKEALKVAQENAERLLPAQSFRWNLADATEAQLDLGEFDVIVSNPPYIPKSEWRNLQKDVRNFEPSSALVGGEQGTELSESFLNAWWPQLKDRGLFALETYDEKARKALRAFVNFHFSTKEIWEVDCHLFIQKA